MLVIGGLLQPGDSGQTPGTILIATSTLHESTFPAWWEDVFCLLFAFFSNIRPRLEKKREEFLRLSGISGNIKTNVQSNYDCLMRFWTRTIYYADSQFERIVFPFMKNLKAIGIEVTLQRMDLAQYYRRLRNHEFDMTQYIYPLRQHPGEELLDFFHSGSVNKRDGRSLMGLEDPAVDAMIESIMNATSKNDLETATSALNRILLWQHYGILNWHGNTHRIAWWQHLKHPESFPPYGFSLNTWWTEQNNKESR
ncbi:hypothetical protein [Endozoicomonas sp. SCSIO W0465]|uniref:hypothetical protein n=1 Tax=Endozoicomonas sp. SCSIO W0465 TaxID=2918516 RepID=UPI0020764648|nr:hypothetical protein [Endozoicomonas sp. SCSIO W0465]USE39490.1 hypothetical protein MJO57_15800 [Endozoicomonas sp. SCSIO W0465]